MNSYQDLWWRQARSGHEVFVYLRENGFSQCHMVHYLQMATEKIAKAYLWRSQVAPPKKHAGFINFLRFLGQVKQTEQLRIAILFGYTKYASFQQAIRSILPIAYELERITPARANDGPNPEYPWPHNFPTNAPVDYQFEVWQKLNQSNGCQLIKLIRIAVEKFPAYVDA